MSEPQSKPEPSQHVHAAYCAQVEREDRLVNNRLSWLLTTEGLLFGSLAFLATTYDSKMNQQTLDAIRWCLPFIGIVAPLSVLVTNVFSHFVVSGLLNEWKKIEGDFPLHPNPFGGQRSSLPGLGPSLVVPVSLVVAWLVIIFSEPNGLQQVDAPEPYPHAFLNGS